MKIKKYPQSCILLYSKKGTLLIDPGRINYDEEFFKDWSKADAVLVTHKHGDHFYTEAVKKLNLPIYSSREVAQKYPEFKINTVKAGDKFKIKDFTITVTKAVHGFLPKMKNSGGEVLENIGFIIEADGTSLYVTSDTICFNNDYKADYLFAPVTGYGITMSAFETALYAKDMGAKKLIICHLDNTKDYPVDLDFIDKQMKANNVEYIMPKVCQLIELK